MGFPGGSDDKESACNTGDPGLIPGSRRSPEEGNGNPLQYSCLENAMDRGAWQVAVCAITCGMGTQRVGHESLSENVTYFNVNPKTGRFRTMSNLGFSIVK